MRYSALYPRTAILDLGRAVDAAVKAAPKAKRPSKRAAKVIGAVRPTKVERERFLEKFVSASCFDVRFHIQPTGDGFEVFDTTSSAVLGKFATLRSARSFVEGRS